MTNDDFLWDIYFEQEKDQYENINGEFERELKNEERYYETKYENRIIPDN